MTQRSDFLKACERIEWPLTVGMAILGFALGFIGFWQHFEGGAIPAGDWNWTDVLYGTLQLFIMEVSADEGSSSWPLLLHVARLLAPFSLIWAAVRGFLAVARDKIEEGRRNRKFRTKKGHVVLLGTGKTGALLAKQFSERGDYVVHVDDDFEIDVSDKGERWSIEGSTTEEVALRQARAGYAKEVVVSSGDDHRNIRVVQGLDEHLSSDPMESNGGSIPCYVEMSPEPGSPLHREEAANHLSKQGRLMVRLFQPDRVAARVLVRKYPPHAERCPGPGDRPIHALVIGFDSFGKEVVKQLIRVCHYLDLSKVQITIVAEQAVRSWRRFKKEVPALEQVADVVFHPADPGAMTGDEWDELQSRGVFDAAYITTSDHDDAFAVAMDARDGLGSRTNPAKVVMCGSDASFLEPGGAQGKQVEIFDPEETAWTVGYLLKDVVERAAMGIHERYYSGRKPKADFGGRPADKPWENLFEYLRDNNRDQADHIDVKLALLGSEQSELIDRAREMTESGVKPALPLDEIALEALAEVEHRRWWASTALAGYTYGETRDDERRHHPNMKPYAELDDLTKQYDRDVICNLPDLLLYLEEARAEQPRRGDD
jgi:hypothetical protein